VGDTSGVMSYATAGSNGSVFLSLGNTTATLASTTYAAGGTTATAGSITIDALSSAGGTVAKTITAGGTTVGDMINAINNSGLGVTASLATDKVAGAGTTGNVGIMITGSVGVGAAPSTSSYSGAVKANAAGDVLSGSISITEGNGATQTISMAAVNKAEGGSTLSNLEDYIQADGALGVTSSTSSATMALASAGSATTKLQISSNLYDTNTGTSLSYVANNAYNVGVNSATTAITNVQTTGVSATATAGTAGGAGGIATIGYSDAAGQSLSTTDLSSQGDAEQALTSLNAAIIDVAAQDGYIGAQINTLNAASQVLSTQAENVTSAQNAVQATDYAQASSNMSKFEILSQTGIAALAQANSLQQEVTKLLQ
jgi:flagellin